MRCLRQFWAAAAWALCGGSLLAQALDVRVVHSLPVGAALPNAFAAVAVDVDQDGRPDLLVTAANGITVLLNRANAFAGAPTVPLPPDCGIANLRAADFDGDAVPDLAAYCFQTGSLQIYHGDGAGGFVTGTLITLKGRQNQARGLLAADLNQDGAIDLAIGQPGSVLLLWGNGDGTFRQGVELPLSGLQGGLPVALVTADFDGDGIPDIATANTVQNDDLSVFLGGPDATFGAERKVSIGCRPMDMATVDFNLDGAADLAVACEDKLLLLSGRGDGTFTRAAEWPDGDRALSVATADLNGDGIPDFVVGNYYAGSISVLLYDGSGGLTAADPLQSIGDVYSVALADFTGDGMPDIAATSYSGSSALFAPGQGGGQFGMPFYAGGYPASTFPLQPAVFDNDGSSGVLLVSEGTRTIQMLRHAAEALEPVTTSVFPLDARLADVNRDGIPDLVLVTARRWTGRLDAPFGPSLQVLPGRAEGGFDAPLVTALPDCRTPAGPPGPGEPAISSCLSFTDAVGMFRMEVGDFNGDGIPDVALRNGFWDQVQIFTGTSEGYFQDTSFMVASRNFAAADFDGDGVTDLAAAGVEGQPLTIFLGGAGGFQPPVSYAGCTARNGPGTLLARDLDGDGRPDLAAVCNGELDVWLNDGSRGFRQPLRTPLPSSFGLTWTAAADLDGDGKTDLIAISGARLVMLPGNGDGTFTAPVILPLDVQAVSLTVADFDGDGRPEVAVVDGADSSLKVIANR